MFANMFQHYKNFGIPDYRQSSFNDALNNVVLLTSWQILTAKNSVNIAQALTLFSWGLELILILINLMGKKYSGLCCFTYIKILGKKPATLNEASMYLSQKA